MSSIGSRIPPRSLPKLHRQARTLLAKMGVDALKPYKITKADGAEVWRSSPISKRRAGVLRKEAIRTGAYGTYNSETLTGWERSWDIELEIMKPRGQGRNRTRPLKTQKRERTREQRALKIEKAMEGMDDRIEEFYAERIAKKPVKTFEYRWKQMLKRRG